MSASLPALTDEQLGAAERSLLGPGGQRLARFMFSLALQRAPRDPEARVLATELGWVDARGLTRLGRVVKDPLREYVFWKERGRRLPCQSSSRCLQPEAFGGCDVLEVGSGGGCNLLTLSAAAPAPRRLLGVEPMPLYRQLAPLLARMAGLPPAKVVAGWGRELPFTGGAFDVVLCYSSHQYMRVDEALAEMARVLRPSGRLLVIGNTLWPFAGESVVRFARNRRLGTLKYDLFALANTVAYQLGARRTLGAAADTTTATPIYPTRGHLYRAARRAGLAPSLHDERTLPTGETLFVAVRR